MAEESYNEFKVRVTDGENLSEIDPVPLFENLKVERSEYVDRLKREHRAAVLARHSRVTKRPIITSEVSHGEVSEQPDKEEPILSGKDSTSNTNVKRRSSIEKKEEPTKKLSKERLRLEIAIRRTCLIEHAFASIMGILAGIGAYVVTKEFIHFAKALFIKWFTK